MNTHENTSISRERKKIGYMKPTGRIYKLVAIRNASKGESLYKIQE